MILRAMVCCASSRGKCADPYEKPFDPRQLVPSVLTIDLMHVWQQKALRFWFGGIVLALGGYLVWLESLERKAVRDELELRSRVFAERVRAWSQTDETALAENIQRLATDFSLKDVIVCRGNGEVLFSSDRLLGCGTPLEEASANRPDALAFRFDRVLYRDDHSYLFVWQSPSSAVAAQSRLVRGYSLFILILVVLVSAAVLVWIYRWNMMRPFKRLLTAVGEGDPEALQLAVRHPGLAPIADELDRMIQHLKHTSNPTRLSSAAWTPQRLREEAQRLFGERPVCVIANREPYIHNRKGKKIETIFPASGLVTAVEPAVRACSGVWIGSGTGSADRETADARGMLMVPPGNPEYVLKRVWLSKEEEEGYYYGFANEGLWPLCHIAHQRPTFRASDWNFYREVNQKFADAFAESVTRDKPIALIQDYHFGLLPELIRKARPDAITSLFWHIPWPNPEVIQICPWREELLRGMLGADLIGFHIQYHCNNFLDTVDRFLEARVDRENFSVTIQGHTCYVKPFPISVEWPTRFDVEAREIPVVRAELLDELGLSQNLKIGIGVDRLDYTKGILERFYAVERFFELHPEWVGKFTFIQIAAPSRSQIPSYQNLEAEVQKQVNRICFRFQRPEGTGDPPILLRITHHSPEQVFRYYRAAEVCIVSSLHDGMNLVAKEYVSARSDAGGALLLSSFTGAARELHDAFIFNPYDTDAAAQSLYRALTSDPEDLRARMQRMRDSIAEHNVYAWAAGFLGEIHRIAELREPLGKSNA